MSSKGNKLKLKLIVDKEKKRVVFAEADEDFVDVIFSFLTLPLGKIIKILGKQSVLGSLGNLYKSVEDLDANRYLQTEACKTMLLHPRNAAAYRCEDLKLNIDVREPRIVFHCSNDDCCSKTRCLSSSVANALCPYCQKPMLSPTVWDRKDVGSVCTTNGEGVFMRGGLLFMVSDDLQVFPASVTLNLSLLQKYGVQDSAVLEEITMDLGPEEMSNLFKRSLISNTPLSDICYDKMGTTEGPTGYIDSIQVKTEGGGPNIDESEESIRVKLLVADSNKVLCAEVDDNVADNVLSFLTLPLGAVVKLLNMRSRMGCVDNLYRSVHDMSLDPFKSSECREMLLSPKLAPYFGCDRSLLKLDELPPPESYITGSCHSCFWDLCSYTGKTCCRSHGVSGAVFIELNPKLPSRETEKGGGYAKGPLKFLLTDDLQYPLSPSTITKLITGQSSPLSKLVEKEADFGLTQDKNAVTIVATKMAQPPLKNGSKNIYSRLHNMAVNCNWEVEALYMESAYLRSTTLSWAVDHHVNSENIWIIFGVNSENISTYFLRQV